MRIGTSRVEEILTQCARGLGSILEIDFSAEEVTIELMMATNNANWYTIMI